MSLKPTSDPVPRRLLIGERSDQSGGSFKGQRDVTRPRWTSAVGLVQGRWLSFWSPTLFSRQIAANVALYEPSVNLSVRQNKMAPQGASSIGHRWGGFLKDTGRSILHLMISEVLKCEDCKRVCVCGFQSGDKERGWKMWLKRWITFWLIYVQ